MNNDYLWDKTGAVDDEIAELERSLAVFRMKDDTPPALPMTSRPVVVTAEKPSRRFRFWIPSLAGAAFAAALVIVFLLAGRGPSAPADRAAAPAGNGEAVTPSEPRPPKSPAAPVEKPTDGPAVFAAAPPRAPARTPHLVRAAGPFAQNEIALRPRKALPKPRRPNAPAEALTAEEKDAYEKLMFALSITSSKLRIVRDKIRLVEDASVTDK